MPSTTPNAAVAYAVVDTKEDEDEYEMANIELNMPNVRTPTEGGEFSTLPEVQGLSWTDDFFENDDDVVAVFDFDYDSMESYYTDVGWVSFGMTILYIPIMMVGCMLMVPCYLRQNVQWTVRAQHVAVTRDGVRFVRERRPTCWGQPCTDAGKTSKTIPFDQITDCDIIEPAGNTCCVVPNTLYSVHIDTASNGGEKGPHLHALTLAGLRNPHALKQLVWAMKRKTRSLESTASGSSANTADMVALLQDIRAELRTNNEAMREMRRAQQHHQSVDPANPIV